MTASATQRRDARRLHPPPQPDNSAPKVAALNWQHTTGGAFRSIQRIALPHGSEVPGETEFVEVECYDLTPSGFSFFLLRRPKFDSIVAAFGTPPKAIYVLADVADCQNVLVDSAGHMHPGADQPGQAGGDVPPGEDAEPMVLVDCRFTKRLSQ